MTSDSTCDLEIHQPSSEFLTTGHVMPELLENLVGVGPMCNAKCTVTFTKHAVNIYSSSVTPIIIGWSESTGPCLCHMSIMPNLSNMPPLQYDQKITTLSYFSAYDLPSVESLIQYFHEDSGFAVRYTWLIPIKAENFALWPGLIYQNEAKACPITYNTLKGHMVKLCQGIRSTIPNSTRKNANTLRLIAYLEI